MKKLKYLLFFSACIFVFPLITHAECDYQRVAELSKMASNVQFSYSYELKDNLPNFTINVINITNDIYVKDYTNETVVTSFEHSFVYNVSGQTIRYDIYSNDSNCKNEKLLTKYVTIPYYNHFSNVIECVDNPSFKYCQTWLNTSTLTKEQFLNEYQKYINKESGDEKNEKNNNIVNVLKNNLKLIIFVIIASLIIPLLIYVKRRL